MVFLDVSKKNNDSEHTNILAIYNLREKGGMAISRQESIYVSDVLFDHGHI